ncbi:hypothetical protein LCGC14_0351350 [marine sediment metagenome]|uniref:BppU N-terminal domain-containing protein n=1 Tax=marine sediment metagenome TaxID=412755 RepID=A0A0F9VXX9_9ZZZZ
MTITEKQLGQARENSTNAVSVYSPGASTNTIIKTIVLCNTSGASATYRLFCDDNGTTYTEVTALAWDVVLPADSVVQIDGFITMNDATGNFAYRSSVANAITITLFGAEIT